MQETDHQRSLKMSDSDDSEYSHSEHSSEAEEVEDNEVMSVIFLLFVDVPYMKWTFFIGLNFETDSVQIHIHSFCWLVPWNQTYIT